MLNLKAASYLKHQKGVVYLLNPLFDQLSWNFVCRLKIKIHHTLVTDLDPLSISSHELSDDLVHNIVCYIFYMHKVFHLCESSHELIYLSSP